MISCSGQLVSTPTVVFQVEAQDAEIIAELLGVGLATSDLFTLPETISRTARQGMRFTRRTLSTKNHATPRYIESNQELQSDPQ